MNVVALDPSLTATGWVAINLVTDQVVGAGVIRTEAPSAAEKKHASMAQLSAARGLVIQKGVRVALQRHQAILVIQEGNAGSKSAKAAAMLGRAQQACVSAVYSRTGGLPLFVTVQAAKKAAVGKTSASKEQVEAAIRKRWPSVPWELLLEGVAQSKRENAYDAASAYLAAYENPAVTSARAQARLAAGLAV